MSRAFDRLVPAIQYQVVNSLGWDSLRPVQELATEAILDGKNCVVLAPTAGGKTEAAFFPLLSRIEKESWRPVSVLYVTPIKALLNNQEQRLQRLCGLVGRTVMKWHGDVGQAARKEFVGEPTDILLTTPESIEAMLVSTRVPAGEVFRNLRAVVVDEIHAFADDDRGAQLAALLERLGRLCGQDLQRIGLSATVGNPEDILAWLQGSSRHPGIVIDPPRPPVEPEVRLDSVGSLANAATVIAKLHPGEKRLVFADSRKKVEELGRLLADQGVDVHVTHSSLAASERRAAERMFEDGRNCVIVATSALELGLDIGDLDRVIQIDAPFTVASFLQRMGRTGRRAGAPPNCLFLATEEDSLIQAAALIRLWREGFVESVAPSRRAFQVLAQQFMTLCLQTRGLPVADGWAWVSGAAPFADIAAGERQDLLGHMLRAGFLHEDGGRFSLGPEAERRFGHRNFSPLLSVFDTPRSFVVLTGQDEIGTVDARWLEAEAGHELSFLLAGRAWRVTHIDWRGGRLRVEPAAAGKGVRWHGRPGSLGFEVCRAMHSVLSGEGADSAWTQRATAAIQTQRASDPPPPLGHLESTSDAVRWHTYAGGAANFSLAVAIESRLGGTARSTNFAVTIETPTRISPDSFQAALRELDFTTVSSAKSPGISKFQDCLPPELLAGLVRETLGDPHRARQVIKKSSNDVV